MCDQYERVNLLRTGTLVRLLLALTLTFETGAAAEPALLAGVASRDITPEEPVWLSGYASRDRASSGVDTRLAVKALALKGASGERTVIVSLDNCEVTADFTAPVLEAVEKEHGIARDAIIIVSSHTHSAPVLDDTLPGMFDLDGVEGERVRRYSEFLRGEIAAVVGAAIRNLEPARLFGGSGDAGFAMNRRVFRGGKTTFGENPDGPVVHDVPVLKVASSGGELRAVLFGYACHGTTIGGSSGEEFYAVGGDYMAHARDYLEAVHPGVEFLYLAGLGADINPAPRGGLELARRHGLELAGAVVGVLSRPMREVTGDLHRSFRRIDLPLADAPSRSGLEADARSDDRHVRNRARIYLDALERGEPRPQVVRLPVSVVEVGEDLTMVFLAGEVVVDYALRLKRELDGGLLWLVGYAAEVPCYIPSRRILVEGGYEAESSLIYYGLYGPFRPTIEDQVVRAVHELVTDARAR